MEINERGVREIEKELERRLAAFAELVVAEAKRRCPVDTGTLRNSIDWAGAGLAVVIGTPVEYGVYQELGFRSRSGRFVQNAFLLPGLRAAQQKARRALGA